MESSTLIIWLGTSFTLFILALATIIIVTGQKRRSRLQLEVKQKELEKQQEVSKAILITQEHERHRIGMEIHDELGPTLSAVRMSVDKIKVGASQKGCPNIVQHAEHSSDILETTIQEFRDISRLLYPVVLMRYGLKDAISDLVDEMNQTSNITITNNWLLKDNPNEILSITFYRLTQELINNALKHSHATFVHMEYSTMDNGVQMTYQDNGTGFNASEKTKGIGLASIQNRVDALNGSLHIDSSENGTSYLIILPL